MSLEPFGSSERNWTDGEKEHITRLLKYDHHVPLKTAEMVWSADVESQYFGRLGVYAGAVTFGIFFFFPIIRHTPLLRRAFLAGLPSAYVYNWGQNTQEELRWGKTHAAWQKFVQHHGQHSKLFI